MGGAQRTTGIIQNGGAQIRMSSLTTPVPRGPYRKEREVVVPRKAAARSGIPPGENVERKTAAGEEFDILPGNRGKCRTVGARRAFRSAFCPETGGNVERNVAEGEEFDIFPGLGGHHGVGAPVALRLSSLTTAMLRGPSRVEQGWWFLRRMRLRSQPVPSPPVLPSSLVAPNHPTTTPALPHSAHTGDPGG